MMEVIKRENKSSERIAMHPIVAKIEKEQLKSDIPVFRAGDTVSVDFRVIEGTKERVQTFTGVVVQRRGAGISETFTVRKISFGEGVERTFPVNSPVIDKIEVISKGVIKRAKLYYLRDRLGKKARVQVDQTASS